MDCGSTTMCLLKTDDSDIQVHHELCDFAQFLRAGLGNAFDIPRSNPPTTYRKANKSDPFPNFGRICIADAPPCFLVCN
eukprot:994426-Pyramimonas_sp.AAC.1